MAETQRHIGTSRGRAATGRHSGFTLVELMVALALSLFLIGGLLVTYLSGRSAALEAETLSRMQENIRFASDFLVRDIRNAGFRDHLTLTFDQYRLIGQSLAELGNGNTELTIRYAGRGSCGRALSQGEELKVIENKYYVEGGELRCDGTEILVDNNGNLSPTPPETTVLATGMAGIEFELLFPVNAEPDSTTVCDFFDAGDIDDACIGVQMTLEFEDEPNRSVIIVSSLRNVIVDRIYIRRTI